MEADEVEVERVLRELFPEGGRYGKSEIIGWLMRGANPMSEPDANACFQTIRWYAENRGAVGALSLVPEGAKKGRKYVVGAPNGGIVERDEMPVADARTSAPRLRSVGNDHPEDRVHIAAHLALLLHRRCLAISMPKTTGTRTSASESSRVNDNPDVVGVARRRWEPTLATIELPQWMRGQAPAQHILIGGEVKPQSAVQTASAVYRAMAEARHNTRYFDEGWLLAPIPERLHAYARALGEEYGVGVLAFSEERITHVDVLWIPTVRPRNRDLADFVARLEVSDALALVQNLDALRSQVDRLTVPIRKTALHALLTNQTNESLLPRLPDSIRGALRDERSTWHQPDLEAFLRAAIDVCLDHFELDETDADDVAMYLQATLIDRVRELDAVAGASRMPTLRRLLEERLGVDRVAASTFG